MNRIFLRQTRTSLGKQFKTLQGLKITKAVDITGKTSFYTQKNKQLIKEVSKSLPEVAPDGSVITKTVVKNYKTGIGTEITRTLKDCKDYHLEYETFLPPGKRKEVSVKHFSLKDESKVPLKTHTSVSCDAYHGAKYLMEAKKVYKNNKLSYSTQTYSYIKPNNITERDKIVTVYNYEMPNGQKVNGRFGYRIIEDGFRIIKRRLSQNRHLCIDKDLNRNWMF